MFGIDQSPGVSRTLANQLLRSGTSVGANVEEAHGSQSKPDFIAKMSIATKEARDVARQRGDGGIIAAGVKRREHFRVPIGRKCEQTHYWLRLLSATEVVSASSVAELSDESSQLVAILKTIVKRARTPK